MNKKKFDFMKMKKVTDGIRRKGGKKAGMIEVEFYGSKGGYSTITGYFTSVDSLKQVWEGYLQSNGNSLKDDTGRLLSGIWHPGYKIITLPPKE